LPFLRRVLLEMRRPFGKTLAAGFVGLRHVILTDPVQETAMQCPRCSIAIVALVVLAGCGRPGAPAEIPWFTSIPLGIEAVEGDQALFVYFSASWCHICERMDRESFADPAVAAALEHFVPVKIDLDSQAKTAEAYLVHAAPAYLLVDRGGKVFAREFGYKEPAAFAAFLHAIAEALAAKGPVEEPSP